MTGAKKIATMILIYVLALGIFYFGFILIIGESKLLDYASITDPYATLYKIRSRTIWGRNWDAPTSGKLIFLFGDSTARAGQSEEGIALPELLKSSLDDRYPELGEVEIITWAYQGMTLFHYYCMIFEARKQSPKLIIAPILWPIPELAEWRRYYRFHQMASMVPIGQQFIKDPGNPLETEDITLFEHISYSLNLYFLLGKGAKLWCREKLELTVFENQEVKPKKFRLSRHPDQRNEFDTIGLFAILSPEDPYISRLRYICKTAEKLNVKVLFYISPLCPDDFDPEQFRYSIRLLQSAAETDTTRCLDLSGLLDSENFSDPVHFKFQGHVEIADVLAAEIHERL